MSLTKRQARRAQETFDEWRKQIQFMRSMNRRARSGLSVQVGDIEAVLAWVDAVADLAMVAIPEDPQPNAPKPPARPGEPVVASLAHLGVDMDAE